MSPTMGNVTNNVSPTAIANGIYGEIVLTKNTNMKIDKQENFLCIPMPGIVAKTDPWKIFTFNTKEGPQDILIT